LHRIELKAKIPIGVNSTNVINEHRQTKYTQASITKEKAGTETGNENLFPNEQSASCLLTIHCVCISL